MHILTQGLADLNLAWCEALSKTSFSYIAQFCQALEKLNVSATSVGDEEVCKRMTRGRRRSRRIRNSIQYHRRFLLRSRGGRGGGEGGTHTHKHTHIFTCIYVHMHM
jgi:hypothetical protein